MSAAGQSSEPAEFPEVKPPLVGFFHALRHRRWMRRFLFLGWLLVCAAILVIGVELVSRRYLVTWHQETGNRHMQPYFMSGGYFKTPIYRFKDKSILLGPGGPEFYGYKRESDIHVYNFDEPISSISERGDFLFQDRVQLANNVGRDDVVRVFVIGGSAAYGVGASSVEKRWYVVLERALSESLGTEVRLIPAAMIGYVSTQERLALDLMVLPRRPDAVIIFDGFNDAVLPSVFGTRPGDPYDQGMFYQDFYSPLTGMKKWLANHSYFCRFLLHRSLARVMEENQNRILGNPNLLVNYAKSTASVYLDNVAHMLEDCKQRNVPCMTFLQPARDLTWQHQGKDEKLDPFTLSAYDEILKGMKKPGVKDQIHDLSGVFSEPGRDENYIDNVHFNDGGHQAVAEAMYPFVLNALQRSQQAPRQVYKPK
jgi:lysophospholipase L1-like esterase